MTKYTPGLLLIAALAACPNDDDPTNPATLWLAPDGAETRVRLVPEEPAPY